MLAVLLLALYQVEARQLEENAYRPIFTLQSRILTQMVGLYGGYGDVIPTPRGAIPSPIDFPELPRRVPPQEEDLVTIPSPEIMDYIFNMPTESPPELIIPQVVDYIFEPSDAPSSREDRDVREDERMPPSPEGAFTPVSVPIMERELAEPPTSISPPAIAEQRRSNALERLVKCLDLNGDGQVSIDEGYSILHRVANNVPEEEVTRIIESVDMNGDGRVAFGDLVLAARQLGTMVSLDQVVAFINQYDLLGECDVSRQDLIQAARDVRNLPDEEVILAGFGAFDANGKGVSIQEIVRVLQGLDVPPVAITLLEQADIDQNGVLTVEELQRFLEQTGLAPQIVQFLSNV